MSIVLDASALLAVVLGEGDAEVYAEAMLASSGPPIMSAATAVEAFIVARARRGEVGAADLEALLTEVGCRIVSLDPQHVPFAVEAWRRFGKGRHPAALDFGDCLAYALAKARGEPLLFKGKDFAATDILAAR